MGQGLCAALVVAGALGCGGRRSEFLGSRVEDVCDSPWPVCDKIAGCVLGSQSYLRGRFPGSGQLAVQLAEPSQVRVSFFIEEVSAAGNETALVFYEERCRSRVRDTIAGKTFHSEAEKLGAVARSVDLSGVGDHLIEFDSDMTASYLLKVDVTPKRLGAADSL